MVIKKNNKGDRVNEFVSNSGSRIKKMFHGKWDDKEKNIILVEDDPIDLYEKIQSYKEEVDINNIVKRFQAGEIDILNQVQGVYADVSKAPKSIAEAWNMVEDTKYHFDRLPADIKEKFGYSVESFINEYGSENWFNKLGVTEEKAKEGVTKENES